MGIHVNVELGGGSDITKGHGAAHEHNFFDMGFDLGALTPSHQFANLTGVALDPLHRHNRLSRESIFRNTRFELATWRRTISQILVGAAGLLAVSIDAFSLAVDDPVRVFL